jgi:hypothetical protein
MLLVTATATLLGTAFVFCATLCLGKPGVR